VSNQASKSTIVRGALKIDGGDFERNTDDCLDLNALLHPAQAFSHPGDVVNDPDLTLSEKRAILASWASDACAVDSVPELRRAPVEGGRPVAFDDIMDALRALAACQIETSSRYHRVVRKRRIFSRGSGESGRSQPLQ
jgi:hypothetical protein